MICHGCRDGEHGTCKGGTWCDCQHKVKDAKGVPLGVAKPKRYAGKKKKKGS